jgi:hypothetical protein
MPPVWSFRFTPYGWLTSMKGTQPVRGRSTKVDASFIDIVEKSDSLVALMGKFEARNGPSALYGDPVWSKVGIERGNVRTRTPAPGTTGMVGRALDIGDLEIAATRAFARSGSVDWLDPVIGACATRWHPVTSSSFVATSVGSGSEVTSPGRPSTVTALTSGPGMASPSRA